MWTWKPSVRDVLPAPGSGAPVMVVLASEAGASTRLATCIVELVPVPVTGFGENVAVTPVGSPVMLSETLPFEPFARFTSIGMSIDDRMPTAWDYAFRPGRPGAYVRVYLKNRDVPLAGKLGKSSLAGVSPGSHDLFLEEAWELDEDGWFAQSAPATRGLWVAGDQIEFVEMFHGSDR